MSTGFDKIARQIKRASDERLGEMHEQAVRALADETVPLGEQMGWIVARDMIAAESARRNTATDAEILAALGV